MTALRPEVRRFLERVCPGAQVSPLAGDVSTRRFFRVSTRGGPSRVIMDYGRPFSGETDDIRLAAIFESANLRVPEIVEACGPAGCLLLEDLGIHTLEAALADPGVEGVELLRRAVLLAVDVATRGTPALLRSDRSGGPLLDAERFRFEMDFFVEHYAGSFLGRPAIPLDLRDALHALARSIDDASSRVLCHRDFHSRNLMVLPGNALAMVDIQDARWGPDSYDLASLLRDAYTDTDEKRVRALIATFLGALPDPPDTASFLERFHRVAAQRMLKALGTFGHQLGIRGRTRFLTPVRRTLSRLRRLLPMNSSTQRLFDLLHGEGLLDDPPG